MKLCSEHSQTLFEGEKILSKASDRVLLRQGLIELRAVECKDLAENTFVRNLGTSTHHRLLDS